MFGTAVKIAFSVGWSQGNLGGRELKRLIVKRRGSLGLTPGANPKSSYDHPSNRPSLSQLPNEPFRVGDGFTTGEMLANICGWVVTWAIT